jgi:hypothetical protein
MIFGPEVVLEQHVLLQRLRTGKLLVKIVQKYYSSLFVLRYRYVSSALENSQDHLSKK